MSSMRAIRFGVCFMVSTLECGNVSTLTSSDFGRVLKDNYLLCLDLNNLIFFKKKIRLMKYYELKITTATCRAQMNENIKLKILQMFICKMIVIYFISLHSNTF